MAVAHKTQKLSDRQCVPCMQGAVLLDLGEKKGLLKKLTPGWKITEHGHLEKEFEFSDFKQGLAFVNYVGVLAEKESHHPDIYLAWGRVKVMIWTHKIDGLSENDFILAAKIDQL